MLLAPARAAGEVVPGMRWPVELLAQWLVKFLDLKTSRKVALCATPVVILAVLIVVWAKRPASLELDEKGRLVQGGVLSEFAGPGIYEVSYPHPYSSPPELTWLTRPQGYRMLDERADGFRMEVTRRGPHDLPPRWEAKGIPVKR
jgi:hypothetical protein